MKVSAEYSNYSVRKLPKIVTFGKETAGTNCISGLCIREWTPHLQKFEKQFMDEFFINYSNHINLKGILSHNSLYIFNSFSNLHVHVQLQTCRSRSTLVSLTDFFAPEYFIVDLST